MPEIKGTIKDVNGNPLYPTTSVELVNGLPTPTILDKGKILIVNDNLEYELMPPTVITEAEYAYINSSEYGPNQVILNRKGDITNANK